MVDKRAYPASSQADSSKESSKRQKVDHNPLNNVGVINPIVQPAAEQTTHDHGYTTAFKPPTPQTPMTVASNIPLAERAYKKSLNNSKLPAGETKIDFNKAPPKMAPLQPVPNFGSQSFVPQQQTFKGFAPQPVPAGPLPLDEMELIKHLEASNYDPSPAGIIKRMHSTSFESSHPREAMPSAPAETYDGLPSSDAGHNGNEPLQGQALFEFMVRSYNRMSWEHMQQMEASDNASFGPVDNNFDPANPPAFSQANMNACASAGHNAPNGPQNEGTQPQQAYTQQGGSSASSTGETPETEAPIATASSEHSNIRTDNDLRRLMFGFSYRWEQDQPRIRANLTRARQHSRGLVIKTGRALRAYLAYRPSLIALANSHPGLRDLLDTVSNAHYEAINVDRLIGVIAGLFQQLGEPRR